MNQYFQLKQIYLVTEAENTVDLKANIQLSLKADSFFGSVMEIKELTDYSNRARNTISMAEGNEC
jgi:hypothetical protein